MRPPVRTAAAHVHQAQRDEAGAEEITGEGGGLDVVGANAEEQDAGGLDLRHHPDGLARHRAEARKGRATRCQQPGVRVETDVERARVEAGERGKVVELEAPAAARRVGKDGADIVMAVEEQLRCSGGGRGGEQCKGEHEGETDKLATEVQADGAHGF